jgi:putative heme transporter
MRNKRMISTAVSAVALGAMVWFVLPKLPDFSEVWGHVRAMTGVELAIVIGVAAWNLATYWIAMMAASPTLTLRQAIVVKSASTAVSNAIPGGSAVAVGLSYAMLGSWGYSKSKITVALTVGGLWNNFVKLAMPVLALAVVAFSGEASGSRIAMGVVGIVALVVSVTVFGLLLRHEPFAFRAGEGAGRLMNRARTLVHRPPVRGWGDATTTFRNRVVGLVSQAWVRLTVTSVVSNLSLFAVLLVTLRAVGVSEAEVGMVQAVAVFSFVRLITAVPIMPGGLGIVEIGLISGLTSAGGDEAQVVAAVLVFRVLTYLAPIVLGAGTYLYWRRNRSWRPAALVPA